MSGHIFFIHLKSTSHKVYKCKIFIESPKIIFYSEIMWANILNHFLAIHNNYGHLLSSVYVAYMASNMNSCQTAWKFNNEMLRI